MRNIVGSVSLDELLTEREKLSAEICKIVDTETELDESVNNPSKRLTITECIDLLNDFALTIDKLNEDNTALRKENEALKFALRAEQALNSVHNSSQPSFRI